MKKHPFDSVSFIGGTLAVLLGIAYLSPGSIEDQAVWALPLLLAFSGVLVIGKTIDRHRKIHSKV